jgi:glycosyltransferase involved in cell wall biosynthesis
MITFLPNLCRRLKPRPRLLVEFSNVQACEPRTLLTRLGRKVCEWVVGGRGIEWRYGTLLRDSDVVAGFCGQHLQFILGYHPAAAAKGAVIPATPPLQILDDPDGSLRRRVRAELGAQEDDFILAFFGYVYPSKGVDTLLHAVTLARKSVPTLRLLVIGGESEAFVDKAPDYPRQMRELTTKLGLDDCVRWTGYIPDEVASGYLRAADACVLPFVQGVRLNNTSYAVAAAHALPVISTRGETLEPDFVDRENVLLCWAGDPKDLAAGIVEVAGDRQLRRTLSFGAAEMARTRTSWEAVTRQRIELLSSGRNSAAPVAIAETTAGTGRHSATPADAAPEVPA